MKETRHDNHARHVAWGKAYSAIIEWLVLKYPHAGKLDKVICRALEMLEEVADAIGPVKP